ncbi:MAG: ABC transporter permease subunit [Syntrophomonadaceae bacterium]|jgi:Cu-processing system permease protein
MLNIMRLTLKEIVNKRIIHIGILLTIVYLLVYAAGLSNVAREFNLHDNQILLKQQIGYQLLTLGWYMSTFLAGTLAILAGTGSIAHEIETGTILSLASKPIRRCSIVLGKFWAYAAITALYSALLAGAVIVLSRHYFQLIIRPQAAATGIFLFMLFPVILVAVTHLFSSLLSSLTTGVCSFMLFTVAIIGGFIEQIGAALNNNALVNTGVVTSLLIPCDSVYRMAVARTAGSVGSGFIYNFGPFGVSSQPSSWMLVYTLVYVAIMLLLAIYFFTRRDF